MFTFLYTFNIKLNKTAKNINLRKYKHSKMEWIFYFGDTLFSVGASQTGSNVTA